MASMSPPPPPKSSSAMEESSNWVEMPDELMANILQRLPTLELLKSARRVCTTWRRICKDPAMWKVIDIRKSLRSRDGWNTDYVLQKLTKQAVDLSCGELIDISIQGFGTDELLEYIVERSSKLKCLGLINCWRVSISGLILKRVPQLEKFTYTPINADWEIEVIGRNCPQLKSFSFTMKHNATFINCDDRGLFIANKMPGLLHLKVSDVQMTNDGLKAILNGCPHLQSLDVRNCRNLYLGGKLGKLCMERIKDFKHGSIWVSSSNFWRG